MEQKVQLVPGNGRFQQYLENDVGSPWRGRPFWNWARKKRLVFLDDRDEADAMEQDELTQGLL